MWRMDDCFIHGYAFYYWMCRLNLSVISFRMCHFFPAVIFGLLMDFHLSLHVGDKFFLSDDKCDSRLAVGL